MDSGFCCVEAAGINALFIEGVNHRCFDVLLVALSAGIPPIDMLLNNGLGGDDIEFVVESIVHGGTQHITKRVSWRGYFYQHATWHP